jgi:hypothetical protein
MDTVETSKPRSRIGWILVALVVGLVVGYFVGVQSGGGTARYATNPCIGSGVKNLNVNSAGAPSCVDVEDFPANGDRVKWTGPAGSTLQVVLKDPSSFPHLSCNYNLCDSGLPASSAYSSTQEYTIELYLKGTPTPGMGTPTPLPGNGAYGRIIIKP